MRYRDIRGSKRINYVFILSFFLFILLFATQVEPQNATTPQLKLDSVNQTDLLFAFQGSNYSVVNITRDVIQLEKPVSWNLLLTNGVQLFSIQYETDPITLVEQENINEGVWTKKYS